MARELVMSGRWTAANLARAARAKRMAAAFAGGRRARAELEQHLPDGTRITRQALWFLLGLLGVLAVYTGLKAIGWETAAGAALVGLLVLGELLLLRPARRQAAAAPESGERAGAERKEVPQHQGFSDDPAQLAEELAEIHAPEQLPPVDMTHRADRALLEFRAAVDAWEADLDRRFNTLALEVQMGLDELAAWMAGERQVLAARTAAGFAAAQVTLAMACADPAGLVRATEQTQQFAPIDPAAVAP